jgi:ABC-type lipoprotein release transport system permease subunit
LEDLFLFGGLSVLLGLLASYFPARRALKISPLMAMNR